MDSQALKDKGNQFFAKGDFANAIPLYTQAIQCDAKNHLAFSNRSAAYLQLNEFQKALDDAVACVSIAPSFQKGLLRLADAQLSLSMFEDARKNYEKCVGIADESIVKFGEIGIKNSNIKEFYQPIISNDLHVEPKYISQTKGKGLFATKDFKVGDVIFQEDAFFFALDPECQKSSVCEYCMKFVEDVPNQIKRSGLKLNQNEQTAVLKHETPKAIKCPQCDAVFCSENCFNKAKNLYHKKLCVSSSKKDHPLNLYKSMTSGPTSTTFTLAAMILGIVANNLDKAIMNGASIPDLSIDSLFGDVRFVQRASLMRTQPVFNGSNLATLQSHLSEPLKLLKSAFFQYPPNMMKEVDSIITEQLFDDILGLVSMNNTTAYVLPPFIFSLNRAEKEVAHVRAHGMCLFLIHSCINHSCSPNVENRSLLNDKTTNAKVIIRAIKPIKKGEELQFTYIDEKQKTSARKDELLSKYGFTCNCPRC